MTWHNDAINPTLATALLIAAGALALVTLTEAIRRNQMATKLADLKGPAVWYLSAIAVAVGVPLFLISTAKLFETLLTENPGDVRWISLLFLSIVGAPFVIWRSFVAQAQADTAAQGMITDRINKAVEGLGAEKTVKRPVRSSDGTLTYEEATEPNLEVRVGAVLALERIAKDSPDDHIQIMEVLCAYIRENACIVNIGSDDAPNWQQRVDTQTAITVIGCRKESAANREREAAAGYQLDLRHANLQCADMSSGRFEKAQFEGALLATANLRAAHLQRTKFLGANLQEANLKSADFLESDLSEADLKRADFFAANLQLAALRGADLSWADLMEANLKEADLDFADLRESDLGGANLHGALLSGANLPGANLAGAILKEAVFWGANLKYAEVWGANLQGADFQGANLQRANLEGAKLESTDLKHCRMTHTQLRSLDFTQDTTFDRKSLDQAFGVKSGYGAVKLPDDDPPAHWHEAEESEADSEALVQAFEAAFSEWAAANPLPKQ